MIIIKHRINTIEELKSTEKKFGVEIDIRTLGADLIVQHEPFTTGVKLTDWLRHFEHEFLIINLKEDGLEEAIFKLLTEFKVTNFFFLDQSIPSFYKTSLVHPNFCSARVSDIESVETILNFTSGWVWFDSHSGSWDYLKNTLSKLSEIKVKKCLMSPELQRGNSERELNSLQQLIHQFSFSFDAICTKYPEKWLPS